MENIIEVLTALLLQPVVALPVAIVAMTALVRSFIGAKWPQFEDSDWYKFTLSAAQIVFGIGLACLCNLGGFMNGADGKSLPWGYVIVVGIVAGFASSWLWSMIKSVAKKYLKLTDKDIQERKTSMVPKPKDDDEPEVEEDTDDDKGE
jgi:uncharacterized membrane protein YedE/YeeE